METPKYVVFADFQFCGLYRSKAAAGRLVREISQLPVNFQQGPAIKPISGEFTEEEFLSYGWGERCAYWDCVNAIEHGYYGRSRYADGKS